MPSLSTFQKLAILAAAHHFNLDKYGLCNWQLAIIDIKKAGIELELESYLALARYDFNLSKIPTDLALSTLY